MAHLWMHGAEGEWGLFVLDGLDGRGAALGLRGPVRVADLAAVAADAAAVVCRVPGAGPETWALVARPDAGVRVNGVPAALGLAILDDRDELRAPGAPVLFFSTERPARVEPFPAGGRGCCPRCQQPIDPGSPAVNCPACGLWHHATDELNCWTYGPQCAGCHRQDTALDAGFRWTPEDL